MKIMIICETLSESIGTHVVSIIKSLAAQEHQVFLVWSAARTSSMIKSKILELSNDRQTNFTSFELKMSRSISFFDVKVILKIIGILRRENFGANDIIHGHSAKGGGYARVCGRILKIKTYYSPHAFPFSGKLSISTCLYYVFEYFFSKSTLLIASSQKEFDQAKHIPYKNKLLILHGYPEDLCNRYTRIQKKKIEVQDRINVSFVGRLEKQKNPIDFLNIVKNIHELLPFIDWKMYGDGSLKVDVNNFIELNDLSKYVSVVPFATIDSIMLDTDVLICTSYYEGFPYLFLDALQAGVPILTTDVGGAREVTNEGKVGIIFDRGDYSEIYLYLSKFYMSDQFRDNQAQLSHALAQLFSEGTMTGNIHEAYNYSGPKESQYF